MTLYGQAEYFCAVSKEILDMLVCKGIITEEQRQRIDEVDRQKIFETYPSIADLETGT